MANKHHELKQYCFVHVDARRSRDEFGYFEDRIRFLKQKLSKNQIFKDLKKKKYFVPNHEEKRRSRNAAIKRLRKTERIKRKCG